MAELLTSLSLAIDLGVGQPMEWVLRSCLLAVRLGDILGLSLGSHTFQVRAIDGAGNVDPTPAEYTWLIRAATALLYSGGQIVIAGQAAAKP